MDNIENKISNLSKLIGNTPLLQINFTYKNKPLKIFSKLEYFNLTGSIKDRVALYILKEAIKSNKLRPNTRILEATSGNTGISFAAISTYLGFPIDIFMPDWMSEERKKLLKSFGANIHLISKEDGGFLKSIQLTEKICQNNPNTYLPKQFSNEDNVIAHYKSTGPEIYNQLKSINLRPSAFVAGVGTGGTIMGIGNFFKSKNSKIKVYPLEPSNSPTISTGYKVCSHRIQGIMDEFIPPILKLDKLDEVISVDDGDSIRISQMFSSKLGLGIGISSGANFLGAVKALEKLGENSIVTTVFPDDNKKYLSTDLMKEEPVKDYFISKDIKLIDFKVIK